MRITPERWAQDQVPRDGVEDTVQVRIEDPLPVADFDFVERLEARCHARVCHHHVEPTHRFLGAVHHRFHRCVIAHVGGEGEAAPAEAFDRLHRRQRCVLLAAVTDRNVGAGLGEGEGDAAADAA